MLASLMRLASAGLYQRGCLIYTNSSSQYSLINLRNCSRTPLNLRRSIVTSFSANIDSIPISESLPSLPEGYTKRVGARALFIMPPIKETIELLDVEQALFNDLIATMTEVCCKICIKYNLIVRLLPVDFTNIKNIHPRSMQTYSPPDVPFPKF